MIMALLSLRTQIGKFLFPHPRIRKDAEVLIERAGKDQKNVSVGGHTRMTNTVEETVFDDLVDQIRAGQQDSEELDVVVIIDNGICQSVCCSWATRIRHRFNIATDRLLRPEARYQILKMGVVHVSLSRIAHAQHEAER